MNRIAGNTMVLPGGKYLAGDVLGFGCAVD